MVHYLPVEIENGGKDKENVQIKSEDSFFHRRRVEPAPLCRLELLTLKCSSPLVGDVVLAMTSFVGDKRDATLDRFVLQTLPRELRSQSASVIV